MRALDWTGLQARRWIFRAFCKQQRQLLNPSACFASCR